MEQNSDDKATENYDSADIRRLLFQMENLFHNRVSIYVLTETVFFIAAATVFENSVVLLILSLAGSGTAFLFTVANLKLYFRIVWLIGRLKEKSQLYNDYLQIKGENPDDWRWSGSWIMRKMGEDQLKYFDSGWMFTWGLLIVFSLGWGSLAAYGLLDLTGYVDKIGSEIIDNPGWHITNRYS